MNFLRWQNLSLSHRVDKIVVAAFDVWVILVARKQCECMFVIIGELAATYDLASIIDEDGLNQPKV